MTRFKGNFNKITYRFETIHLYQKKVRVFLSIVVFIECKEEKLVRVPFGSQSHVQTAKRINFLSEFQVSRFDCALLVLDVKS